MHSKHFLSVELILTLSLLVGSAFAQPDLNWSHSYGGAINDVGRGVTFNLEGDIAICGDVSARGGLNPWIMKLRSEGDSIWHTQFGSEEYEDMPWAIVACPNGGYTVAGRSQQLNPPTYIFTISKFTENGEVTWERAYGEPRENGTPYSIMADEEENYYLAGHRRVPVDDINYADDAALMKVSSDGDLIWSRHYGANIGEHGNNAMRTSDGGFAIVGDAWIEGSDMLTPIAFMTKVDQDGNLQWMRTYGDTAVGVQGRAIIELRNGCYVLGCDSYNNNWANLTLIWLTSQGDSITSRTYFNDFLNYTVRMMTLENGDILVCGVKANPYEPSDFWIIRLNPDGDIRWEVSYGGRGGEEMYGACLSPDGGVIAVGATDSYGNGTREYSDVWVIRTAPLPIDLSTPILPALPRDYQMVDLFPNPFNNTAVTRITLPGVKPGSATLYDVNGRMVWWSSLRGTPAATQEFRLDGANLPVGRYQLVVKQGDYSARKAVVVIK